MTVSRRKFIGVLSVGICGLAGCANNSIIDIENNSIADIKIINYAVRERTVMIRVVRSSDGEQVLDESFTLRPAESESDNPEKRYSEVAGDGETVQIDVTVKEGPEGTHEFTDSMDTGRMQIDLYSDTIEFSRIAA